MTILGSLLVFLLAAFTTGCGSSLRAGGELQPGRYALHRGDQKSALAHFQRAAEIDPNYVTDFTLLKQGVWTYVGRAYYDAGNYAEARKAFERASSLHPDDYMADLYLGLALLREGNRDAGQKEVASGLRGLASWLEYVDAYHDDGRYWDPSRIIRTQIDEDLRFMSGKEINPKDIIARGERIGEKMEREIDMAPVRWRRDLRNSDGRTDNN
ncbi:MAG TPA: tetratricopeptide repeat protein [Candidatus Acidoferrales bacterium]|nr:tetratricopeptide repeat protein [Candidatus Acidoferrales bacterium]